MSLTLTAVSALRDNYIWILANEQHCVIVDPGEATPVLKTIADHQWQPQAILLTHHHADHTGGVAELIARWPQLEVYGPQETAEKGATTLVDEHDQLTVFGQVFSVIATPGHTLGHISYYAAPYLFCGDTLFSGGCGRLFEGSPEQMHQSLSQLAQLPDETLVCCAHEYTQSNLEFAHQVLPDNQEIGRYLAQVNKLRANNQITLPTTLQTERRVNIFLKCADNDVKQRFAHNPSLTSSSQRFAELRRMKNNA